MRGRGFGVGDGAAVGEPEGTGVGGGEVSWGGQGEGARAAYADVVEGWVLGGDGANGEEEAAGGFDEGL